ncbi:hypothetical protein FQN57_007538 [Myotisia sp. PD_48]|nr:hypothetical protein FQN57_007538 [Myotisia sp. PD_48]
MDNSLKTTLQAVHASSTRYSSSQHSPVRDPRHVAVALHHARQIQTRKDTEALVLSRIETLMDLPTSSQSTATSPSPEDVDTFLNGLTPFQPTDYDNLILERNINGSCGYTLCPNPHRKENQTGKFRIVWGQKGSGPRGQGREMKFVPKEQLEMWCSDQCAERAMYVRVQLSEIPAWERMATPNKGIVLLDQVREPTSSTANSTQNTVPNDEIRSMQQNMLGLTINDPATFSDEAQLTHELSRLAVDTPSSSLQYNNANSDVDMSVVPGFGLDLLKPVQERESQPSTIPSAPQWQANSSQGGAIEGFRPSHETFAIAPNPDQKQGPYLSQFG